jgi:DNA adenine methylase
MTNYSPLRYPGGKSKLSNFIKLIIKNIGTENCTYIEPFAGGSGVALSLLLENCVEKIVINDYDKAIYSFWRAIKQDSNGLLDKIANTPITIEEWYTQKEIYTNAKSYSLDLAFATLFLNRTNRSGILTAGPIGGYEQAGEWKLDVRFDKGKLIEKVKKIADVKDRITVYNKDILSLITRYIPKYGDNVFIYFDPPYYNKGQKLYKNFFTSEDHKKIKEAIISNVTTPWVITYDAVDEIKTLYAGYDIKKFDLTYSAANKGTASELMIFSDSKFCPSDKQMEHDKITINLRA